MDDYKERTCCTYQCHAEQLGARGAELETAKEQLAKILFVPFFGVVSCDVLSKIKS